MRPDYAALLKAIQPADLERFVADWLSRRVREYAEWDDWGGAGDRGRDVVGYVTDNRHEGPWDNFQCKRLKTFPASLLFFDIRYTRKTFWRQEVGPRLWHRRSAIV
jgi:hypothetical protein